MKTTQERYYKGISRKFSDLAFSVRLYFLWLLVSIILFGILGIIPSFSILNKKIKLANEMKNNNVALSKKIEFIKNISPIVVDAKNYTQYLDEYLPTELNIQDYLVEVVLASSQAGYDLSSFRPNISENGSMTLEVKYGGGKDPVSLVSKLEELKRITQINKIKIVYGENEQEAETSLSIFSMEGYK